MSFPLEDDVSQFDASSVLRALANTSPESLFTKSRNHAMTPREYVEEAKVEGVVKDSCLEVLQQALQDYEQTGSDATETDGSSSSSSSSSDK